MALFMPPEEVRVILSPPDNTGLTIEGSNDEAV